MNIKKIEAKPMFIHKKQKTMIHDHEPKNSAINGNNIYTVNRSPKIKEVVVNKESYKTRNGEMKYRKKRQQTYRKSTVHGEANFSKSGIGKFRKNIKESNQSIKMKQTNLRVARKTGAIGVKATINHMEGGQEVQQAAYMAHEAFHPVTRVASSGTKLLKKQITAQKKPRLKKVEAGKKLAKRTVNKTVKDTTKGTVKKATKKTVKNASKLAAKTTTTATTTVAGSAGGPAGLAIGMAAGYASRAAVDAKDTKRANRNRKITFFLDKMKSQENQQDSIAKLAKDLITRKILLWIKTVAPMIGLVLLLLVLVVAMIAVPVIAVVAVLYNSPFAIFLPSLEEGDTVQTVTSAYVAEFNRDVNTLANNHTGYDEGQIVYVDYEGVDAVPSNYYDIISVYMVKYGVGDTATIMNDTSKAWLQSVVDDMCSYTPSSDSKTETVTNEDGTTSTTTTTYLYVNVSLKSYRDMISEYGFNSDEVDMLEEIMSPENLSMLGWAGGGSGGDPGEPSMGIGNFFGSIPTPMQRSNLYGVEIDSISGRIARQLYQKATINITGFEKTNYPDNFFDVVIGNVPFGDYKIFDPKYNRYNFRIHDYFVAKALDQVRPGGMVAVITTKGTLDKSNPAIRKYIAERAELVGAIRLPNTAFKDNAGTEVTADILFLQKRERKMDIEPDWVHLALKIMMGILQNI